MTHFSGDDLIFYKENDKILSGGYSIDSILLKNNMSPMTTLNTPLNSQMGGKNVSSCFENLAIPAGLLYLHKTRPTMDEPIFNDDALNQYQDHVMIDDDLHEKLLKLVEINKKKKKKTRKNNNTDKQKEPKNKKKSRKNVI
jgi:hypothetical protein